MSCCSWDILFWVMGFLGLWGNLGELGGLGVMRPIRLIGPILLIGPIRPVTPIGLSGFVFNSYFIILLFLLSRKKEDELL